MSVMSAPKKKRGEPEKRKPYRTVRLPESLCLLVDKLTDKEIGSDLTEHTRNAMREYLQRKGLLPKAGE